VNLRINVVAFDVPFPADYGGVIDVFYKLRWFKARNVSVILHCFTYGRQPSAFLDELCEKVYYYRRRTGARANSGLLPYTVASRRSAELERNLLSNNYPIFFEVLHTCYLLDDKRFSHRLKIFRHSNIEHDYYRMLSLSEKKLIKKFYLLVESFRLKRFEKVVGKADVIFAVNQKDTDYFLRKYPAVKAVFLPSFHPYEEVQVNEGHGKYILFHGNLGISENYESAAWLIDNVFSQVVFEVIIAGKNPPDHLRRKIALHRNIHLIADPTGEKMDELIANAQIHCLHTHQPTGLKLKLLHVLFRGRFIIANRELIDGTGLHDSSSLILTGTANEFVSQINNYFNSEFTMQHILERVGMVRPFRNQENIAKIIDVISGSGTR
jgi:hypothetical protein